ncbi:hypothetical protein PVAP13_7KG144655 [Panicum virgatum]|uniref:Secreted protein n=1 Tax=Panicum virgatum TaxID=38727 RepID=A0A8T0QEV0_PANVG|nr:hypothetical protein PVAP13_7KG144655 [Panicum virgatum]
MALKIASLLLCGSVSSHSHAILTMWFQRVFLCNFFSSCFSSKCLHPGIEFPVVYDQYVVTVFLQCFC